ncbi:Lead, cadmium, zinc and mercury transporting ATPase; Copper-translocating P-type ATPase [hydrothermal vent metagenome]|uniref:Lead, cadmium, zinc and mercury transporting ATPase Copper-translocating P-type ATPase n=1 Tax=hydrothermal vent metagenome TaxID=652676 RepID=A0A3B0WU39_9ZZZZ
MSSQHPAELGITPSETVCFHCALPVNNANRVDKNIQETPRHFCCHGCSSVCEMIYDSGLEGFYQRTPQGRPLSPPPEPPQETTLYDIDDVQREFVQNIPPTSEQASGQTSGDQHRQMHLIVEGIHCSACVWLIERSLTKHRGIMGVKVNLSRKQLFISWDNAQTKISTIIKHLGRIGYAAIPYNPESAEGVIKKQNHALLLRMAFAAFCMMNLLWISVALYSGADEGGFKSLFQWLGFALATPTLLYSGWPFLRGAWLSIKHLNLGMDVPIATGALATYSYSVFVTLNPSSVGEVYYDTVVNFIFVILVGRFLEAKSKRHAVTATQRLMDLQPRVASAIRNNETCIVPIRALQVNENILVKPGEKIPVDGIVVAGESSVDEALLSGESTPLKKRPKDHLFAGTINIDNALTVKITATLQNTSLGRIISLVEQAQASKAPIQCTADKIVPWFISTTLLLATLTFIYWSSESFELALLAATSVLIITCPCAFGLATPMSIAVASGLAARHGLLIKNGAVLELLSSITHFVFDKTGTLTEGKMRVKSITTHNDKYALLEKVACLESRSEHAIARAILDEAASQNMSISPLRVKHFSNQPGMGVSGEVDQSMVFIGNARWLTKNTIDLQPAYIQQSSELEEKGISCIHIGLEKSHIGFIAIADQLRNGARELITNLRKSGIELSLLSGDKQAVVEAIANELGGMNVIAEVLPAEKDGLIKKLQRKGDQIAMIGDGVNDAPALIRADVGIAIGSGTDVSIESADIVLLNNDLHKICLAAELSRRTLRTIRQNIALSIAYNTVMIPLAMMAFITPLFAAIAMPLSSLAVIGNASRIRSLFKNLS